VSETEKALRDIHDLLGRHLAGQIPTDLEPYQSVPIPPLPRRDGGAEQGPARIGPPYPPAPDPGREGEVERLRAELDRVRAELVRLHVGLGEAQAALENVVAGLRALTTVGPTP
jgi:hypothetical protein